ncbi:MAG: hypothetical protein N3C13_03885 [Aquificaceae bacterium]|nr:hypothetical protein [Aquificaceae bacterium]MCX8060322.1 hypothetical protein [Aquificaceae bacterium]MDW8097490.1 hypothetical protein [Aquificaceae bacterium]
MKVLIRGVKEDKAEEIAAKLTELGLDPSPLYRSLLSGRDVFKIECPAQKCTALEKALSQLCEVSIEKPEQSSKAGALLLSLFLDNLLLFYLLKLSVYSPELKNLLFGLFNNTRGVLWLQALFSAGLVVSYYYIFLRTKGGPPAAKLLDLTFTDRLTWTTLFYSLPLPALYLVSIGSTSSELLGLFLLSFSVALAFQLGKHPEGS